MTGLRREVRFEAGYDHSDEDKDKPRGRRRGCHGLQIRFLLHGDDGTIQFLLYTDWLPSWASADEWHPVKPQPIPALHDKFPMAADLGHHWDTSTYEGEKSMDECDVRPGGKCFYDGSGLRAEPVLAVLLKDGSDGVWAALEAEYEAVKAMVEEAS